MYTANKLDLESHFLLLRTTRVVDFKMLLIGCRDKEISKALDGGMCDDLLQNSVWVEIKKKIPKKRVPNLASSRLCLRHVSFYHRGSLATMATLDLKQR